MVGTAAVIIATVIIAGWVLFLAAITGMLAVTAVLRGRRQHEAASASRRKAALATVAARPVADPDLLAGIADLRRADPGFDDQLLRDAAQLASLFVVTAMATGDERALRQVTTAAFWGTFFGRHVAQAARDIRLRDPRARSGARIARLPVDYQAAPPELVTLTGGGPQRATVRLSFSQLGALLGPGATATAAAASATSLATLASSFGTATAQRANGGGPQLAWLSWTAHLDLEFTRPAGSRTDPGAAVSTRTCATCGDAYHAELATSCASCGTPRPVPWGQWRLSDITAAK